MSQLFIQVSLAVAEAIVQRRQVSWIAYSDGQPAGRYANV